MRRDCIYAIERLATAKMPRTVGSSGDGSDGVERRCPELIPAALRMPRNTSLCFKVCTAPCSLS